MFDKRVAFLISAQHLIPHGGIGQFCKSFSELCLSLNYAIDIVLDKEVDNSLIDLLKTFDNVNFVTPSKVISKSEHTNIFSFSDSLCLETMMNFRNSLMTGFQKNVYDVVVINTPEALFSTYLLGINDLVQVIFYTHNENIVFQDEKFKGVFNKYYDEMIIQFLKSKDIVIATQSPRNAEELKNSIGKATYIPMPISEKSLLIKSEAEKSGVLFIGRWEERKNPEEFIRMISETRFPAKIMTNEKGKKRFIEEFKKIGFEDYDIRCSIIGEEKVNFIKSAKVFYMPSKSECFPFALMENIGHSPCVVLDEYKWHDNFNCNNIYKTHRDKIDFIIKVLYNTDIKDIDIQDGLSFIQDYHNSGVGYWSALFNEFKRPTVNNSSANFNKIVDKSDTYYSDYISNLNRFASIEDIISVLRNIDKFNVKHSKTETFISKNDITSLPSKVKKSSSLESFF